MVSGKACAAGASIEAGSPSSRPKTRCPTGGMQMSPATAALPSESRLLIATKRA